MYTDLKLDIIILAGQSNAEGNGYGEAKHKFLPNDSIFQLEDYNRFAIDFDENGLLRVGRPLKSIIIPARERINEKGERIGSFALYFAQEYVKNGYLKEGRDLLIIESAIGGTGFAKHHWGDNAVLQTRMLKMVDYALSFNPENRVVAFLWHQGEHDAFENAELTQKTRERFYYEKFGFLVKQVKEKCGNIPVIAAGFSSEWVNSGYVLQSKAIYRATKKVLKENGGLFVKTEDLLSNNQEIHNGDNIHFSKRSLYKLGKRYFAAYKKIVKKSPLH